MNTLAHLMGPAQALVEQHRRVPTHPFRRLQTLALQLLQDRRLPWAAATVILLLTGLALLSVQALTFEERAYLENVAALRRIKQLDTQVELEVLKSRIHSATRHDALVNAMQELSRLVDEIDANAPSELYEQAAQLEIGRTLLKHLVREKATLVDSFVSSNTALHHSAVLLPSTADDLLAQLEPGERVSFGAWRGQVRKLMAATLMRSQGTTGPAMAAIHADLERLEVEMRHLPPDLRARGDMFASRVRTILHEQNAEAGLLAGITHNGVAEQAESLNTLLSHEEQLAHDQTQRLRGYLLLLSGGLAMLLLYAAVHMVRSQREIARINRELQEANEQLEQRVQQRTHELRTTQDELVASARQAGMAEIATNVLHNVGNILNSVNVSAALVSGTLRKSRARGLSQAVQLMDERAADLGDFLTHDEKGKLLPGYLGAIAQAVALEQKGIIEELERLTRSIDHIKDVVATQQSYAGVPSTVEPVQICELAEDALRMNADALTRHQMTVVKDFAKVPVVQLDRARVLQILVNLISNAKNAMTGMAGDSLRITLRVEEVDGSILRISVADEGEGIPAENLTRIFAHGFTTRKAGHGFGLHSCALAAKQMGGTLAAHSDGVGRGATFTLDLPILLVDDTRSKACESLTSS